MSGSTMNCTAPIRASSWRMISDWITTTPASGLTSGAITAAIDRPERAGYVQRAADPGDRRRILVEPTQHDRTMGWEMFGPLAGAANTMLAGYSDEQIALLIEFHRLGRESQERQAAVLRERLDASRDG